MKPCDFSGDHDGLAAGVDVYSADNDVWSAWDEEHNMPYEIGEMYEVGEQYMIGSPAYAIGGPTAMPAPFQGGPRMVMGAGGPQAVPVVQMPRPTLVRKKDPSESRIQPLGCNQETAITVGATGTAQATPQRVFKPLRYVIPDTVAPDFIIDGIFIGVDRQSPAITGVAAESFGPSAIYSNVEFSTCQLNQTITVNPRNIGGADRRFFSTFYGQTIF